MGCTNSKDKRKPDQYMAGQVAYPSANPPLNVGPFSTAGNLVNGPPNMQPASTMTASGSIRPPGVMTETLPPNIVSTPSIQPHSTSYRPPTIVPPANMYQQIPSMSQQPPIRNSQVVGAPVLAVNPPLSNLTNRMQSIQPLIKQNTQIEVLGGMREAAKNMNYTPVSINHQQSMKNTYDTNSNYAIQTMAVGNINSYMDQRRMDMDMDMGATGHTPKIFTYTYGGMMGGPLVGDGGHYQHPF